MRKLSHKHDSDNISGYTFRGQVVFREAKAKLEEKVQKFQRSMWSALSIEHCIEVP